MLKFQGFGQEMAGFAPSANVDARTLLGKLHKNSCHDFKRFSNISYHARTICKVISLTLEFKVGKKYVSFFFVGE